jgi:hypothetical protein
MYAASQQRTKAALISVLKETQANWHKAYVVSDSVKLVQLLSPNVTIVRTSGVVLNKTEALSFYRTRDTSGLLISTHDQKVRVNKDLALVTSVVNERDKGVTYPLYVTDVLERKKGEWKILRSQWTLFPGHWDKAHIDPVLLKSYAGTYESATGRNFVIEVQTNQLTLGNARGQKFAFFPRSDTHFFIPGEPDELLFIKEAHEPLASHLVFVTRSNTTIYKRKK